MAQVVTVDDHDRSRIRYAGGTWFAAGSPSEYAQTTFGTRDVGSRATFVFTGSSVKVYGTVPEINVSDIAPVSTYSVDGSSPITFAPSLGSSAVYRALFYASPPLKDGEHTLVITSTVKDCYFWLDYLEYTPTTSSSKPPSPPENIPAVVTTTKVAVSTTTPPNSPSATTNASEKSTNTPTTAPPTGAGSTPSNSADVSGPVFTSNFKQPDTSTTAALGASETSSPLIASGSGKVPAGAIAGAVVGGVIALLVLLLLIWRCRRKPASPPTSHHPEAPPPTGPRLSLWSRARSVTGVTPFSMAENAHLSPPGTAGDRPIFAGARTDTPTHGYGYGYATHGGTAEKGLHSATPSHSHSRSLGGSATGRTQDLSGGSSRYGVSTTSTFPPPRSYSDGSPYHVVEESEDMPPAYRRTLDGPNLVPG